MDISVRTADYEWRFYCRYLPPIGTVIRHPEKGDHKITSIRLILLRSKIMELAVDRVECNAEIV